MNVQNLNEYMVKIDLPAEPDEEFAALIPAQQSHVDDLMRKGILTGYSLSADRSTLWMTFLSFSEQAVAATIRLMPMSQYMQPKIIELMFHQMPTFSVPTFSWN
jgi:hypothetical protein